MCGPAATRRCLVRAGGVTRRSGLRKGDGPRRAPSARRGPEGPTAPGRQEEGATGLTGPTRWGRTVTQSIPLTVGGATVAAVLGLCTVSQANMKPVFRRRCSEVRTRRALRPTPAGTAEGSRRRRRRRRSWSGAAESGKAPQVWSSRSGGGRKSRGGGGPARQRPRLTGAFVIRAFRLSASPGSSAPSSSTPRTASSSCAARARAARSRRRGASPLRRRRNPRAPRGAHLEADLLERRLRPLAAVRGSSSAPRERGLRERHPSATRPSTAASLTSVSGAAAQHLDEALHGVAPVHEVERLGGALGGGAVGS